ncbi:hypothetical protein ACWU4D_09305 [Vibrio sp. WJH972]
MRLVKNFIPTLLVSVFLCGCNEYSELEDTLSSIADLEDSLSDNSDTAGLSAFNLTNISAGTTDVKQMTLTWTSALDSSGVAYVVCQKDISQSYDCNPLASVIDSLTTTINVDSLVEAASSEYFILAYDGSSIELSNEEALAAETVTQMVGYVKASNTGSQDSFGYSVALSGDGNTLAVGAYLEDGDENAIENSGSVYLFNYDNDRWVQVAYLKADNAGIGDEFGFSVSLNEDGSTLAVGAYLEDSVADDATDSGAVYLFGDDNGDWDQVAYLKASNLGSEDQFGRHVALSADGTTLAVGAHFEDNGAPGIVAGNSNISDSSPKRTNSGAVYLFHYSDNSWVQTAYIKSSNTWSGDWFGRSVALNSDGSRLAVGSPNEDLTGSIGNSGAVYLYSYDTDSWTQTAHIKASNPGSSDQFGRYLALSSDGSTLAVGARGEDNAIKGVISDGSETTETNSESDSGAVYVFSHSGSSWEQESYLKASNTGEDDFFGHRVALSSDGDTLAVTAYRENNSATGIVINGTEDTDVSEATNAGAAYLFSRSDGIWEQAAYIKPTNTSQFDHFGFGMALSADGNTLAVGAKLEDSAITGVTSDGSEIEDTSNEYNSGAVYIY